MGNYILIKAGDTKRPIFLARCEIEEFYPKPKISSSVFRAINLKILKYDRTRYCVNAERTEWNDACSFSFIYPEYKSRMIVFERNIFDFPDDEAALLYYEVAE